MVRKNPAGNKPSRQPAKKSATTRAGVTSPTPMDKKSPVRAQEPRVDGVIPASDELLREMGILTCQLICDLRKAQKTIWKAARDGDLLLDDEILETEDWDEAAERNVKKRRVSDAEHKARRLDADVAKKLTRYLKFLWDVEHYAAKHRSLGKPQIELVSLLRLINNLERRLVPSTIDGADRNGRPRASNIEIAIAARVAVLVDFLHTGGMPVQAALRFVAAAIEKEGCPTNGASVGYWRSRASGSWGDKGGPKYKDHVALIEGQFQRYMRDLGENAPDPSRQLALRKDFVRGEIERLRVHTGFQSGPSPR